MFLVFCLPADVAAQDINTAPDWQFRFGGKVTEFNEKKQKDLALEGAVCTLLKGSTQVQQTVTNNTGKFKFILDPNNEYTVTITKAGYITKRFTISTYNVPVERAEAPFVEFDVEIGLFKQFPGLDYSCLNKPIAKIAYNPAKDIDDFDYDKVYTSTVQACIDELKRLEAEARAKQKLYEAAIDKADKLFGQSNWQGAKDAYNEALGYISTEQYPKDQIIKCDEKMGLSAQLEADYKAALAEADRLFAASDWVGAKAKYQQASGLKVAEQYPKDQIVKCDNNATAAGKKLDYDNAIKDADAKFAAGNWEGAKAKYQEASNMMTLEPYPKNQIIKCDAEIAKAANKAKYDAAILDADTKFKAGDFANAKTKYQEASALIITEQYPKDQIIKCDGEIAKQGVQQKYDAAIKDADVKFAANDFANAKTKYQEASALKNTEQYPKDQIVKCDNGMAGAELQKKYDAAIADADLKFKAADFAGAKVKYQEASGLKSTEQYPKDQIVKCDAEIAKKGLQEQYDAAIKAADAKFNTQDFAGAKPKYQEASNLKSTEQYPKDQIAKCDVEIAKKGLQEKYDAAIKDADVKFAAADFSGAKTKYQEASGLKGTEQYPKDQIVKCDAEIAKKGLQQQYDDAIKAADSKFGTSDWAGAKAKYQEASNLKSTEQYPKDQIVKCDAEIAKKGLRDQYNTAIKDADIKFKATDWTGAKAKYMEASALIDAEQYPKDQIVKCDAEIAKKGIQEQYNALILDADAKFKATDFSGAKSVYQQALDLKSAEAYPKTQITKCDAEIAKLGVQQQYDAAIKDADAKFASSDWAAAKTKYQVASSLKTSEAYPKGQITKCDANITADAKNKQYTDLIAKADSNFKATNWAGAKSLYQQASGLKVAEVYPKDQIVKCDAEIAKVGKEQQYKDLIVKADAKFALADWSGAKAIYLQATAVKAEEQYPKDQVTKCDDNITAGKNAAYNKIIVSADSLFKLPDYVAAKAKYKEANTSRPLEAYPKDQMAKCDVEIAKLGVQQKYDAAIKDADAKFAANDFTGAKTKYQEASTLKVAEQYPKDQIVKCDVGIANLGTQAKYDAAIKAADAKFKLNDWAGAKVEYQKALGIKAGEEYPTNQSKICDDNIAAAANRKYTDAIADADKKFDLGDWTAAKAKYQEASAMRITEQYPKERIVLCDQNIKNDGVEKTYLATIAAADVKFKASDWAGAKAKYNEALGLKAGEQYPKDQIKLCDDAIANAAGLEANYARKIATGDSAFKTEDYETAKSNYEGALTLKPKQSYPQSQLDEINRRLGVIDAANAKDAKYRATIAKADSLFALKEFKTAKVQYQSASTQRPAEQYPKDRMALCDTEESNRVFEAAKQKRYDDLIKKADAKFAAGSWADAKKLYQDALKEKPVELYPKQQIEKCDKKLNPTAKADTARTPEQIKEDYRNDIAKSYPQGLTQIEEKDGGNTTIKRIVVIGEHGYIYTKKIYTWGVFYFKDGVQISEGTFNNETSPSYIQQQQAAGSK